MPETNKKQITCDEALRLFERLKGRCKAKLEAAGSIRRGSPVVGDLDVLVWGTASAVAAACRTGDRVVELGEKRTTVLIDGIQVNAYAVKRDIHGAMLMFLTGPGRWNIGMRMRAKRLGKKLSQYGVFPADTPKGYDTWNDPDGRRLAGATEQDVFAALDKPWKSPELRGR